MVSLTVNQPKNGLDLYSWTKVVANTGSYLEKAVCKELYLSASLLVHYRNSEMFITAAFPEIAT